MLTPRSAQAETILRLDVTETHLLSLKQVSVANRTHFVLHVSTHDGLEFQRQMDHRLISAEKRYERLLADYS